MPGKSQLVRRHRPSSGNNSRHALRGTESNFAAVRRANATSQQPIATSQPNSRADTHTHRIKQPPKEILGRGEGFPWRRQQEHPPRARPGLLRIAETCEVQLSDGPA